MKHAYVAALAASLALAGCAGSTSLFSVNQNTLDGYRTSFSGVLKLEVAYSNLPTCAAGANWTLTYQCKSKAVVATMAKSAHVISDDFDTVQAKMTAGTATVDDLTAIETAIGNLKALNPLQS